MKGAVRCCWLWSGGLNGCTTRSGRENHQYNKLEIVDKTKSWRTTERRLTSNRRHSDLRPGVKDQDPASRSPSFQGCTMSCAAFCQHRDLRTRPLL